jgi:prevent-host-death family protein
MSDTLPLAEVKAKFSEVIDRVVEHNEQITVTRKGKPVAVILSYDEFAALEETLELLSDPNALRDINRARKDIAAGKFVSGDELRAKYLRT